MLYSLLKDFSNRRSTVFNSLRIKGETQGELGSTIGCYELELFPVRLIEIAESAKRGAIIRAREGNSAEDWEVVGAHVIEDVGLDRVDKKRVGKKDVVRVRYVRSVIRRGKPFESWAV